MGPHDRRSSERETYAEVIGKLSNLESQMTNLHTTQTNANTQINTISIQNARTSLMLQNHADKVGELTAEMKESNNLLRQEIKDLNLDVRVNLREHEESKAPHPDTLGARVAILENFKSKIIGGFALVGGVGVTGLIALIRSFNGH